MKPWHNSCPQPNANRMNMWHPQVMQPPNQVTPTGYPYSCPPIKQNMNVYWQDQRRMPIPKPPWIEPHLHHQQNLNAVLTHQPRQYQQHPQFCLSGYQQGRQGNESRNFHYPSQQYTPPFPVQPSFHHQQQYPTRPPSMMMSYQPQYLQPPSNMYPMPVQPPSFNCHPKTQPGPIMHPYMMMPSYQSTVGEACSQRGGIQTLHVSGTTENLRPAVLIKSPAKFQNARNLGCKKQGKGFCLENVGNSMGKKESCMGKKSSKSGYEAKRSWSSVVVGTSKEPHSKVTISGESADDTGSESFEGRPVNSGTASLAGASSSVLRQISMGQKVSVEMKDIHLGGDTSAEKKGEVGGHDCKKMHLEARSFFRDDSSDTEACAGLMYNFDNKEIRMEESAKVSVIDVKDNPFTKPSCQKSLGIIFETKAVGIFQNFGMGSQTFPENGNSQLNQIKEMAIFNKVEEMKSNDDILNCSRIEKSMGKMRVSRAVSREPRLKEIRNKWNIADKFGDRKSCAKSRRNAQRRASSNESSTISPTPIIASQIQSGVQMSKATVTNLVSAPEGTEQSYEYDINIDDMINKICHSSTPSFTSSDDGQSTHGKFDEEILGFEHDILPIKIFEEDEHYSTIKGYSDDVLRGFIANDNFVSDGECAVTECDEHDADVESIRTAFRSLSANISAIKERLEGAGSEPQTLFQETEASFLKFQESYLKAKTTFQEDTFKYPTDIHYDELREKYDRLKIGQAMYEDYEIKIDFKKCCRQRTTPRLQKTECSIFSDIPKKATSFPGSFETHSNIDGRLSNDCSRLMKHDYYGELNIKNSTSNDEKQSLSGVAFGTLQYQSSKEKVHSTSHMPPSNISKKFPLQNFCSRPPYYNDQGDKVDDIDPNTIDFGTSEMQEDTISASSSVSTIRLRDDEIMDKMFLEESTSTHIKVTPCEVESDENGDPYEYLRPGVYSETLEILTDSGNVRKEEANSKLPLAESDERPGNLCQKKPSAEKRDPSDRGSYLQPGIKQKSLVEMMKNSGGVDRSVPFSIKLLETRNQKISEIKNKEIEPKRRETFSKVFGNCLEDSSKPAGEPKRIPSLFEVNVNEVFKTSTKSERRKPSASSYGSGDAPSIHRRNESLSRNETRPGSKKLTRKQKAASKGSTRRKEEVGDKEAVKGLLVSSGQKWRAIAPGMYRNVHQESKRGRSCSGKRTEDLKASQKIDAGATILNSHLENPLPLSKILESARKNPEGDRDAN